MATNDATGPEEARTFALAAVRLIVSEKLELRKQLSERLSALDEIMGSYEPSSRRRWPGAGPSPRARAVVKESGPSDKMVSAKAAGYCAVCRDAFPKGEKVVWRVATQDCAHLACHTSCRTPEPSPG